MDKIFNEEQLINHLAWVLHYESWYKESIEGKFGLNSDGTGSDHGRFRKSKDKTLDEEFIKSIQFDENGYSLLKDEHGNPYYKMENGEFYVDSAIKGFDFLHVAFSYFMFCNNIIKMMHTFRQNGDNIN